MGDESNPNHKHNTSESKPEYTAGDDAGSYFDDLEIDPDRTVKSIPVPEAPSWGVDEKEPSRTIPDPAAKKPEATIKTPEVPYFPRSTSGGPPPPPSAYDLAPSRPRARRRRGRKGGAEWAWVVIAGAMFGVVGLASVILLLALGASDSASAITPTATSVAVRPTAVDLRSTNPEAIASGQRITLDNGEDIVLEPWDGTGRLTILMMGVDRRLGETGWGYLTDTIMLVSIDPASDEIGILSIPRDLYVPIRGYAEPQRINTPLALGENRERGYGPTLAMETVQWNLGMRVHEYVIIDFAAFIGLVDAIGGIEVTTDYTINDPNYPDLNYGYDPFYLPAGTHELAGYDALRFARTRHGDSDIHRASRQQQVLFAIRSKILDFNLLPRLIFQAPSLYANFKDNVNTSLDLDQMIELAWYLKDVPSENISTGVIDFSMLQTFTTESGQEVLIPIRSRIGQAMVDVFGPDYDE